MLNCFMVSNGEALVNTTPTHTTEFTLKKALNNQSSPYFLQSSDNPGAMVVQEKLLSEENYVVWESSMGFG